MSDLPTVRSYHVSLDTTPEAVFDAVVDLRNFPKWAIHFCKEIRLVTGGAIVTTPSGEVYFGVTGDRDLQDAPAARGGPVVRGRAERAQAAR